jgi:hypothetical protein
MKYLPSTKEYQECFHPSAAACLFTNIAAMYGDIVFQAPRRFFLQSQSGKQPIWSYGALNTNHQIIIIFESMRTAL